MSQRANDWAVTVAHSARERVYMYVYICEESTTQSAHRLWWFLQNSKKKLFLDFFAVFSYPSPICDAYIYLVCGALCVGFLLKKKIMCTYWIHNEFIVFFSAISAECPIIIDEYSIRSINAKKSQIKKKERKKNKINIRFQ